MQAAGAADPLVHVASREWPLQCNWKVFVDNYLVRAGPHAAMLQGCELAFSALNARTLERQDFSALNARTLERRHRMTGVIW